MIQFVQWVIKHMVVSGEQKSSPSGSYARGTACCGGHKQQEVVDAYVRHNSGSFVTTSVWGNSAAPCLTSLWNFAVALKERLQRRSLESDGSAVDCSVPAAGRPAAAAAGGPAPGSEGAGAAASISGSRGPETAADGAAARDDQVPGSPPLPGSSNESGGGSASEVCASCSAADIDIDGQESFPAAALAEAEALVVKNSREMLQLRVQNGADNALPRVPSSTSAAGGGGGGVADSASASLDSTILPPPPPLPRSARGKNLLTVRVYIRPF